jgi:hypothetical protein
LGSVTISGAARGAMMAKARFVARFAAPRFRSATICASDDFYGARSSCRVRNRYQHMG